MNGSYDMEVTSLVVGIIALAVALFALGIGIFNWITAQRGLEMQKQTARPRVTLSLETVPFAALRILVIENTGGTPALDIQLHQRFELDKVRGPGKLPEMNLLFGQDPLIKNLPAGKRETFDFGHADFRVYGSTPYTQEKDSWMANAALEVEVTYQDEERNSFSDTFVLRT